MQFKYENNPIVSFRPTLRWKTGAALTLVGGKMVHYQYKYFGRKCEALKYLDAQMALGNKGCLNALRQDLFEVIIFSGG